MIVCVDLQIIVDRSGMHVPAAAGDDAAAGAVAQAERVADGKHPVAGLGASLSAHRTNGSACPGIDLQQRQVGGRVGRDDARRQARAVAQRDARFQRMRHDVEIGDDVPVRIDEEP